MPYSPINYAQLPTAKSPMNALISRAMETFGKGVNLSYLPREKEAGIFSKEIGPLAALASNKNFTGFNPQVQKMIAQRIGGYLGKSHGGQSGDLGDDLSTAGYADDENIYNRLKEGAKVALSPGGKTRVAGSRLAGEAEKLGLPSFISKALGGNKAAGKNAEFEQAIEEAVQKLSLKGYSESRARKALERMAGENDESYASRIKPLFIASESNPREEVSSPVRGIEEKVQRDMQEKADAEATAEAFGTTPEMVLIAQSQGIKTASEFKKFLSENQ
jgi:hypothetical protein